MKTKLLSRVVAGAMAMQMTIGCGDVVIKVQKKPKDVDLSALENFSALNLQNSEDFLKHLDNLKVIAVDLLIKQLASRDYRGEVRSAIRNYRKFLIERAKGKVKIDDSFYASADQCQSSGLNFNMDQANDFLGVILKTAVLAKISEVNAPKINPGISKELAAIGQLILMELGLKIEGDVNVDEVNGVMTTTGNVTLALAEIADEQIDDATKLADKTEILGMSFVRALGDNYTGTFSATVEIGHAVGDAAVETLQAKLDVERKAVEDKFLHSVAFALGVKDQAPNYSRKLTFEQVGAEKTKVKLTDTMSPGSANESSMVTILDIKAGTQCKLDAAPGGDGGTDKGDEGGFVDAMDADGGDGAVDAVDGATDGSTDGTLDGAADGTVDGGADGAADGDDDNTYVPGKGGKDTPGQNPGQHPGQMP